eukprot:2289863-Pyramimonas_sp.AAC.1
MSVLYKELHTAQAVAATHPDDPLAVRVASKTVALPGDLAVRSREALHLCHARSAGGLHLCHTRSAGVTLVSRSRWAGRVRVTLGMSTGGREIRLLGDLVAWWCG